MRTTFVSVITLRQSEKVMNDQEPRRESRGRETPQQREQRLAQKTVMLHLFASRQSTRIQQLQSGSFVTGCRSSWIPSTLKLVSSPDLIRRVYRLQYPSFPARDTESDPRWGWFWVWDRDYLEARTYTSNLSPITESRPDTQRKSTVFNS